MRTQIRVEPFTVALIGPDGAGKSSVAQEVQRSMNLASKAIYMGVNLDSSNLMLPTTRLILALKRARGRNPDLVASSDSGRAGSNGKGSAQRALTGLRRSVHVAYWVCEEWFRQLVAWYYQRRGHIVIFDRHFFCDYYAYDVIDRYGPRPLSSRIHGIILDRFYPKPDMVVYLDAPPEVLMARKPGTTREFLERRRDEYLEMGEIFPDFVTVDATRPMEEVVGEVAGAIHRFHKDRTAKGEML